MKYPTLVALALASLFTSSLHAVPIPLSGTAEVSVAGAVAVIPSHGADEDSYAQSKTKSGSHSSYHLQRAGAATAKAEPQPGWTYPLPLDYQASSEASLSALFGANGLSLAGNVSALTASHAQVGTLSASATASFDFLFRIDAPMLYTLTLQSQASHVHGLGQITAPGFSLTSSHGGLSLGVGDLLYSQSWPSQASWALNQNGVLLPGDYRLVYTVSTGHLLGDPLGESSAASYNIQLAVAPVPEPATTAWLLLAGLACVVALRHSRFRPIEAAAR